ncbi:hypothetical protein GCM10025777_18150 [Membranihabitans marinus]
MDAGTASLQPLTPNVTPSPPNEVTLCYGQSIRIQHDGNYNLTEDPDPSTPAGIRYAIFTAQPTTTAVVNKANLLGESNILKRNDTLIVASADPYGNFIANNDGSFLSQLGLTGPQTLWFAPITVHNISGNPIDFFETDDACIQINSNSAFSITYLNELNYTNTPSSTTDGSITVTGGLPELDGSNYTVTLTDNDTDMDVPLTGSGSSFNYANINPSSAHTLTIADDNGCQRSFILSFEPGTPIVATIPDMQVAEGSNFCIPVTAKMFRDVGYFSFSLKWNPGIIELDTTNSKANTISNVNPILMGFTLSSYNADNAANGVLTLLWLTPSALVDVPDDETLFEVCFTAKGQPGQSSPVTFEDNPTAINFGTLSTPIPYTMESGSVTIAPQSGLDFSYSACADAGGNSTLDVTIYGGIAPYSYGLVGPSPQASMTSSPNFQLTGLLAGSYTLTITDGDGSMTSKNIDLSGNNIVLNPMITANNCTDVNPMGQVYLENIDPTAYSIEWVHNGLTYYGMDTLKNIESGNFTVTVTDQNNCSATISDVIPDNQLDYTVNITNAAACDNSAPGQADITITGGTPGYTISRTGYNATTLGSHTLSFYNSDSYRIADINGCAVQLDFADEGGSQTFTIDTSFHNHIRCSNPGSAVDSIGGRFRINVTSTIPGEHFMDADVFRNGIPYLKPMIVNPLAGFIWLQDLEEGDYEIVIRGSCGSRAVDFEIRDLRNSFLADAMVTPIGCNGGTGSIDITMTPAKSTYTFDWSNMATTEDLTGLAAGEYMVTILDPESNCSLERTYTIQEGLSYTKLEEAIPCDPSASVSVGVTITSDYNTITWDGGETTEIITATSPGYYPFTITLNDATCADIRDSILVESLSGGVDITMFNSTIVSECNTPDAFVSVNLNVPLTDVDFSWDDGPLMTGKNDYRVYDDEDHNLKIYKDNCVALDTTFSVDFMGLIKIDSVVTDISCNGANDGSIDVFTTGGGGAGFSYQWSHIPGGPSPISYRSLNSLGPGTYDLQIMDLSPPTASPCPAINLSFTITEPAALSVAVLTDQVVMPTCPGDSNGMIPLEMIGGTPGDIEVLYSFSGGSMTTDQLSIDNARASNYTIQLTDARGCEANTTYTLMEPEAISFNIPPIEEPLCAGYTTTVSITSAMGGAGTDYQFAINGGIPSPLGGTIDITGGSHTITVFDANGCSSDQDIVIRDPNPISVAFNTGDTIQVSLGETTDITARVTGENPIVTYDWMPTELNMLATDNMVSFTAISNLPITLTATDSRGCMGIGDVFVLVRKTRDLGIPNAFTPNGDGENETLTVIPGPSVQNIKSLAVYDKYGALVWQKENINPSQANVSGWDGVQNGKDANAGLYVFLVQVEFIDGEVVQRREDVMLIK